MKVLSCSITTKALCGGGMEPFIEFPLDGATKITTLPKTLHNQDDRSLHSIENTKKWNIRRVLKKGLEVTSLLSQSETDIKSQLFGQPLSKICPDESSLPKPIMEVLTLLWKKGPSAEGVFRKTCNNKNMRFIRDQLNSGLDVDMREQPVALLVGLLKSFLKELPGSLLISGFYDSWIKALETKDPQQKTTEIKRVVDLLPGHNRLLLQHLVNLLHRILESKDTNKMDAHNLAVCIAPTLLQLDSTPLDEQKAKLEKVLELTQFLIETGSETLGENIRNLLGDPDEDNSDSLFSQHHDSVYDSTDADADGDPGECGSCTQRKGGSSPSLLYPGTAIPSCPSDATCNTFAKPTFNRRCSEPIIFPSTGGKSLHNLARSNDDCSRERRDFVEQPLKKQISDDSFLLQGQGGAKRAQSFTKLGSNILTFAGVSDPRPSKDCSYSSSCSLESAASNQSDGSFFTSSPLASPTCTHKGPSIHQAFLVGNGKQDLVRTASEKNKRSKSAKGECKIPVRTKSFGALPFTWGSMKKGDQRKEKPFRCGTLQEDSQKETEPQVEQWIKPRPLSGIDIFPSVVNVPCRLPSYKQAIQSAGLPAPPHYYSMTVQDARELGRRSRPTSVNEDFLINCPVNQYQGMQDGYERRPPFRQRAKSESVPRHHLDTLSQRCSQPVFEEIPYAKESCV